MIFLLYGNLYLGAAARVLVWDQVADTPDQAFPTLVTIVSQLAGTPWLGAIAITGVVSAAIATADSLLLMTRRRHRARPAAEVLLRAARHREGRALLPADLAHHDRGRVGIVSFFAALRTPDLILNIVSYAVALVGVAFFFPMLFGMNSPYSHAAGRHLVVGGRVHRRPDLDRATSRVCRLWRDSTPRGFSTFIPLSRASSPRRSRSPPLGTQSTCPKTALEDVLSGARPPDRHE